MTKSFGILAWGSYGISLFQTNKYFENNTSATVVKCFETNLREVPQWVEDPENRLHTGQMGKYAAAQIVHGPLTRKADAACKCLAHHSEDIKYFKENKRGKFKFKKKNQQLYFKCHLNNQKNQLIFFPIRNRFTYWCCEHDAVISRLQCHVIHL